MAATAAPTTDYAVRPGPDGLVRLSPTDVAQYVRLNQCGRYLRLRLHERNSGRDFLRDFGVNAQPLSTLLSRSGARFEAGIADAVRARFPAVDFVAGTDAARRRDDNAAIAAAARGLAPGATLVLLQPRLGAALGGWRLRGDADLVRLERDGDGALRALVADAKSSTAAKVEHRLQVAFYREMLAAILEVAGVPIAAIGTAVLYRGAAEGAATASNTDAATLAAQRSAADRLFGVADAYLETVADEDAYLGAVRDLVSAERSAARRVADAPFEDVPFALGPKCDGCLYDEFCLKWCAERDDLSLLPRLAEGEKAVLRAAGLATARDLAALKDLRPADAPAEDDGAGDRPGSGSALVPAPGREELVRRLSATWPVGPRLDELVHRARRYRDWRGDPVESLPYIPGKGYGSLPYSDAQTNPNLVRVYLDAQHDPLHDRLYLLGALVQGCEAGVEQPARRRSVVRLAEGPPESAEREERLLVGWLRDTLRAVVELAAPDAAGEPSAPVHLIFWSAVEQRRLLEALGRHGGRVLGATPLYDFMTQLAAFDSPVASYLDGEIRDGKNYPMVCQSLHAVAAFLGFDWDAGTPYRALFRPRIFDFWSKFDEDPPDGATKRWFFGRARFASQLPAEYAYGAWGELPPPTREDGADAAFRTATREHLEGFEGRRLEAMERIAQDLRGNRWTTHTPFVLPDLAAFEETARDLAAAMDEFVTVERHVELAAWKSARLAAPERRVLAGETLIVRYLPEDQLPGVAEQNRENERRRVLNEGYRAAYRERNPTARQVRLSKEEKAESDWSQAGLVFRLRVETAGVDCDLEEALNLATFKPGERLVLYPRLAVDSRLPAAERVERTPTAKQLLYGLRVDLVGLRVERDAAGRAAAALAEVRVAPPFGGTSARGFLFAGSHGGPLAEGARYTLDPDPNNVYGFWTAKVTEGLVAGRPNALYDRLLDPTAPAVPWGPAERAGQEAFLAGLDAFHAAGLLHGFEPGKRDYIGGHGAAPTLLVQGPPGTGKSYTTAFALFARLQGAMAAGRDYRALVTCKTHAATDVLLKNVARVRQRLAQLRHDHPECFAAHFDARLLEVPLFRVAPRAGVPEGIMALRKREERAPGELGPVGAISASRWCIAAVTPGGTWRAVKEAWDKDPFGHGLVDCLVLDEASQMNLPEAAMAALPLRLDGQLIVVGDHRQMPPIVKHAWDAEPRRTFQTFRAFDSLFLFLLALGPPVIRFAESFRLHAELAEFLREEIYRHDGIAYHSKRMEVLEARPQADPFVAAALAPEHPLVVVVHDEAASQLRNPFEQGLVAPILEALAAADGHALDAATGLGVVVPHRAQRAALQERVRVLNVYDPATGQITGSSVDTVERFQGGERRAIVISATESDRAYLLQAGEFLLDPRRLTVALSRAQEKLVLVAARSVFEVFGADEETFANAQIWKNLLRRVCTVPLWEGERDGVRVEVWGNNPASAPGPTGAAC